MWMLTDKSTDIFSEACRPIIGVSRVAAVRDEKYILIFRVDLS